MVKLVFSSGYQGCYKDRMPVRDLPKRFTRFDTTPEACISECRYQNYKFAGVQYGYLCFCGNAFGRYGRVKDEDCNSRCNGDVKRNCGAFWHNSVYSVGTCDQSYFFTGPPVLLKSLMNSFLSVFNTIFTDY